MKIAVITPWDIECGIALYAENLVEEWTRAGHEVTILAETVGGEMMERHEAPTGCRVIRCWTRDSEFRRLLEMIRYSLDVDVVNIQHEMSYCSLPHLWNQLIDGLHEMGIPVTVTYHTIPYNVHPVTENRNMDGVIVLNHHAAEFLVDRRGWEKEKVHHVAHAALLPISPSPERLPVGRIVTWGFLTSHKGYSAVMDAMGPLFPLYDRMRLTIYGAWVRHVKGHQEHYLEKELRPEIAQRGLSEKVGVLTGFPHQRVLQDLIADSDISVLYYGTNNTGYASSGCLQTAFSAARPVIASGAAHFDVLDEYADAVIRVDTVEKMRHAIWRLMDDGEYYAQMAERVRQVGLSRHQEHAAEDYIEVFKRAICVFKKRAVVAESDTPQPSLSIIIPAYNRRESLREAIETSRAKGVEIIVVDDGSTDGTGEMMAKDYPGVKLVTLPERFGPSYARNIGIKEARGEYVKFLDSDDVHLPGWLEPLQEAMKEGYDVITMGCVAGASTPTVYWERVMYTSQITVKRSALTAVGGFDVSISYEEEHELLKRLDDAAYKAHRLKVVGVVKRTVDDHSYVVPSASGDGDAQVLRRRLCAGQKSAPVAR